MKCRHCQAPDSQISSGSDEAEVTTYFCQQCNHGWDERDELRAERDRLAAIVKAFLNLSPTVAYNRRYGHVWACCGAKYPCAHTAQCPYTLGAEWEKENT